MRSPPASKAYPSYLEAFRTGRLKEAADKAFKMLASCSICPRNCGVDRLKGEQGFCRTGIKARVASFMPHHGEEPPISGSKGSGTIFFSCCNMGCLYCQNFEFSQKGQGREAGPEGLAGMMLELQGLGCHNINLVTPTHVMPQILQALLLAVPSGLSIPLVYNTGGYELDSVLRLLDGIVDVYLPDMRYASDEMSRKFSAAPDYPVYCQKALKEMQRQVGAAAFRSDGVIKKGMIIRHLVLPNNISGTKEVMRFIKEEISKDSYISLMSQYTPYYQAAGFKDISRRITLEEYEEAVNIMHESGLSNGWTQDSGGLERFAGIHIKPITGDDA